MLLSRFLAPNSIAEATFLSDEEKAALQACQPTTALGGGGAVKSGSDKGSSGAALEAPEVTPPRRTLAQDWASLKVAVACPIVWCSGAWRCLYAMAVYGLQYFTPLIIKATLTNESTSNTIIVLLTTVPYAAAALYHLANGMHSQVWKNCLIRS